jgi:hypothetical protein
VVIILKRITAEFRYTNEFILKPLLCLKQPWFKSLLILYNFNYYYYSNSHVVLIHVIQFEQWNNVPLRNNVILTYMLTSTHFCCTTVCFCDCLPLSTTRARARVCVCVYTLLSSRKCLPFSHWPIPKSCDGRHKEDVRTTQAHGLQVADSFAFPYFTREKRHFTYSTTFVSRFLQRIYSYSLCWSVTFSLFCCVCGLTRAGKKKTQNFGVGRCICQKQGRTALWAPDLRKTNIS